ncbi:DUF6879 family protein [Streptomyces sp. NPDC091387]|uniref:DUF6879 family protein n=1 Tax=Streptomyces sp. NPDC091387 TaxID=3365998 RepID=UPI003821569E
MTLRFLGTTGDGGDCPTLCEIEGQRFLPATAPSLMRFVFDEDDTTVGVLISEDPTEVLAACQARDKAWHHAVRAADFAGAVRSTA